MKETKRNNKYKKYRKHKRTRKNRQRGGDFASAKKKAAEAAAAAKKKAAAAAAEAKKQGAKAAAKAKEQGTKAAAEAKKQGTKGVEALKKKAAGVDAADAVTTVKGSMGKIGSMASNSVTNLAEKMSDTGSPEGDTGSPGESTAAEFKKIKEVLEAKQKEIDTINQKLQGLSDTFVKKKKKWKVIRTTNC